MTREFIIKIECPDEVGLVNTVTGILRAHQINIVRNDEFVCRDTQRFFMRSACQGGNDLSQVETELIQALPPGSEVKVSEKKKKPVVILATKEPYCLGDLLVRCVYGDTPAEIKAVIGNHDHLRSLTEGFGVQFIHIPAEGLSREEHEAKVIEAVEQYSFEYLVLAKYMRILTPEFTERYANRILNIHHSFLPAFIGAKPYAQAHRRGVKIIGATSHFVTQDLDEGPIISQDVIHVDQNESAQEMASAGRDVEKIVLARALDLVLSERVFVQGNKTIVF